MEYCILRTSKLKDRASITSTAEHNFRLRLQGNINPEMIHENVLLTNKLNADINDASSFQKKLTEYYNSLEIKERSDNVLMLEFMVTASPEFFIGKTEKEVIGWAKHQQEFMKQEFGQQLQVGILHLDERSPHIHFMVSTEIESEKRYKNRYGEKIVKNWSLNAKRYDREFLIGLHDRHAEFNKKYGLKRGEKNKPKKVHIPLKQYYMELAQSFNNVKKEEKEITTLKKFREVYPVLKKAVEVSYECILDLLEIINNHEIQDAESEKVIKVIDKIKVLPTTQNIKRVKKPLVKKEVKTRE